MSAWRLLVREIDSLGGQTTRRQLNNVGFQFEMDRALTQARDLGLVERVAPCVWALTEKGRAWCENRLATRGRSGGMKFVPTWTAPLAPAPLASEESADDPERGL